MGASSRAMVPACLHASILPLAPPPCVPQTSNTRSVTLETALAMLALPKDLGPNPATGRPLRLASRALPPCVYAHAAAACACPSLMCCPARLHRRRERDCDERQVWALYPLRRRLAGPAKGVHALYALRCPGHPAYCSAAPGLILRRCPLHLPSPPQGYDPVQLSLADALQLLATKSRWTTSKAARAAALQAAEQHEKQQGAAESESEGSAASGGGEKKTRAKKARTRAAAASSELEDEPSAVDLADTAARLVLDAAASLEIDQLRSAMGPAVGTQAEADAAKARLERVQAARGRRGPSAYNFFVKRELRGGLGPAAEGEAEARLGGRGRGGMVGGASLYSPCLDAATRRCAALPPCCSSIPLPQTSWRRQSGQGSNGGLVQASAWASRWAPGGPSCRPKTGRCTSSVPWMPSEWNALGGRGACSTAAPQRADVLRRAMSNGLHAGLPHGSPCHNPRMDIRLHAFGLLLESESVAGATPERRLELEAALKRAEVDLTIEVSVHRAGGELRWRPLGQCTLGRAWGCCHRHALLAPMRSTCASPCPPCPPCTCAQPRCGGRALRTTCLPWRTRESSGATRAARS